MKEPMAAPASAIDYYRAKGTGFKSGSMTFYWDAVRAAKERRSRYETKDETDKSGTTPLMVAASWGHTQTVVNLLHHGTDPSKVDSAFRTALHLAVDCHDPSLTTIHALCHHGKLRADVDARDAAGVTALMIAAGRGNILVVKCLLDCGANPIACDYHGTEAIDYCKRGDYKTKSIIKKYSEMPPTQWRCLAAKQDEYKEVVDVTRILHMLQKGHVITPQLEAIVLADPSHGGRVERLLGLLQQRGRQAFDVFCQALRAYYPVLGYELVALSYVTAQMGEAPS